MGSKEIEKILSNGDIGVLALGSNDDSPYAVPLNYVYDGNYIYFHCAKEGYKLNLLSLNQKVSFCVVGNAKISTETFDTFYKSVIIFGKAEIINDLEEKRAALRKLVKKYSKEYLTQGEAYINSSVHACHVIKVSIDYMSGKGNNKIPS